LLRRDLSKPLAAAAARGIFMKKLVVILLLPVVFGVAGSFAQNKESKGSALLAKLEADFAKDVAEHGHDAFVAHFAEDGVELEAGGGIKTKVEMLKDSPWPADLSLAWTPVKAEMAGSGDLGYTYGNYVLKSKDKEGKLVTEYGKYTSIWKKQKDGSWKVVVDMGNSSPAPK
jgi:ketosteroid isomerase-like protein